MERAKIGDGTTVADNTMIGVKYMHGSQPPKIGKEGTVRAGTIIYDDVIVGDQLQTGHHALIREGTSLGDGVLVGTNAVIDGASTTGNSVSMQTGVYVPRETEIGDRVFLGPSATLLNDMYPVRSDTELAGPRIEDDVSIGANATPLPDVTVRKRAFVAAGAVVTRDVPAETLAVGNPAEHRELQPELQGGNNL